MSPLTVTDSTISESELTPPDADTQLSTGSQGEGCDRLIVYIDGSSLQNPGPAGIGIRVTKTDGTLVKEISHSIGIATCNQAEYLALLTALEELIRLGARPAEIRTDSQLLFSQLTGRYRVKNPQLRELYRKAHSLLRGLPGIEFVLISREENSAADRLARAASSATAKALRDATPR